MSEDKKQIYRLERPKQRELEDLIDRDLSSDFVINEHLDMIQYAAYATAKLKLPRKLTMNHIYKTSHDLKRKWPIPTPRNGRDNPTPALLPPSSSTNHRHILMLAKAIRGLYRHFGVTMPREVEDVLNHDNLFTGGGEP